MSRKILNDVRKVLCNKGFINVHRMVNEDLSKPLVTDKFPRRSSRFLRTYSEKYIKRNMKRRKLV